MKSVIISILFIVILFFGFLLIGNNLEKNNAELLYSKYKIRIAQQYGMQYAAVYIAKELRLIEKYLPGIKLEWNSFGGGSAITEALIGNHLDIGFMGIPPAIIAMDKGAPIRIALGISVPPNNLMVNPDKIVDLNSFKNTDKIAVPGIGSIQHILLSMGAKKYLGNAKALDNNIIALSNPDAFVSLINKGGVVAHFTTMPYLQKEMENGMKSILSGSEIFGDASIVCVTSEEFHNQPQIYAGFVTALSEAVSLINQRSQRAIDVIARIENISEENVIKMLNWEGTNYTTSIYGLMGLAQYMFEVGYIKNEPKLEHYVWENVLSSIGNRAGKKSPIELMLGYL